MKLRISGACGLFLFALSACTAARTHVMVATIRPGELTVTRDGQSFAFALGTCRDGKRIALRPDDVESIAAAIRAQSPATVRLSVAAGDAEAHGKTIAELVGSSSEVARTEAVPDLECTTFSAAYAREHACCTERSPGSDARKVERELVDVTGSLTKEEIAAVIRTALPRFTICYERSLAIEPQIAGKVSVHFLIDPEGKVAASEVLTNAVFPPVGECVRKVMASLKFPSPRAGGIVEVTYPFVFDAR